MAKIENFEDSAIGKKVVEGLKQQINNIAQDEKDRILTEFRMALGEKVSELVHDYALRVLNYSEAEFRQDRLVIEIRRDVPITRPITTDDGPEELHLDEVVDWLEAKANSPESVEEQPKEDTYIEIINFLKSINDE